MESTVKQPRNIGGYRLLSVIGRGGFADVYLAEHIYLRTQVALKIFRDRPDDEHMERFLAQTRALVRLRHPHILPILACDIEDGRPFLVMPYVPGGTLRQRHPRGSQVSLAAALSYVRQVAPALDTAHRAGQLHGDIKPENMLLDDKDTLLLSDFGLAPGVERTPDGAQDSIAGTVTYMAPEQLAGQPEPASDQYALAILVYEWLCGKPPFSGTYTEVAMQHALVEPPSPRQFCQDLSPQREQVLLRALSKNPQERFPSAQAFADALSQTASVPVHTHKGISRRTLVGGLVGAGGVAALGIGLGWKYFSEAQNSALPALYTYRGHTEEVYALSWSPDSTRLLSADLSGSVQVWQALAQSPTAQGKLLASATIGPARSLSLADNGFRGNPTSLAWAPGTDLIALGDDPGKIQVWDGVDNHIRFVLREYPNLGTCLALSPDGTRLAATAYLAAQEALIVAFWEMTSGNRLSELQLTSHLHIPGSTDEIVAPLALAWAPGGTHLALSNGNDATEIWEVPVSRLLTTLPVGSSDLVWSPDSTYLGVAHQVWNVATGRLHHSYPSDGNSLAWSPDGKYIVTGGKDTLVSLWDANIGQRLRVYKGHTAPINVVRWSPNGQFISSASDDRTVRIFASNPGA